MPGPGRIATVPHPGSDPVEVAAVLMDGMDLVVLGLGGGGEVAARLRGLGVDVVDAPPDELAPALADHYLAMKAAGRL